MWQDFQGVIELTERERCKDDWWNEVSDQIRSGRLSENNWKYLHGKPVDGCSLSAEERASRCRVIAGPNDPRLQETKSRLPSRMAPRPWARVAGGRSYGWPDHFETRTEALLEVGLKPCLDYVESS